MSAPIGILTNLSSINANRHMSVTSRQLQASIAKLSSGMRITSAADDAAGVAVSTGFEAITRSQMVAQRNANDAVAMLQTAESAYDTVADVMIRMRELAIQASNDTLTATDRTYLDTEFQQLVSEIGRISNVTDFNGIQMLASDSTYTFQVGVRNSADDVLKVKLQKLDTTFVKVNAAKVGAITDAQTALTNIDAGLEALNTERASIGAAINQLTWSSESLGTQYENLSQALSQIRDVDITQESARLSGYQVLMQAGVSMLAQANQSPQLALRLLQ